MAQKGVRVDVYMMPPSFINYACHIGSTNVISTKVLACVNDLPWLGNDTFHWCKALQHQIPCLALMFLVLVKAIVS